MAITEDASTPAVVTGTGTGTLTTASFSPPVNTLLVALVGGGWGNTGAMVASVTDSAGGTWTAAPPATGTATANRGVAAIFTRYLSSAPGAITVSATVTNLQGGRELAVRVLNGAASSQSGAGSGTTVNATTTTSGTVSVTTTVTGSQVYGIADDTSTAAAYTVNGVTTILSGGDFNDATDTIRLVAWKGTSTTGTPGATTFGGTWAATGINNIAALEILPVTATTFTAATTLAGVSTLTATLSLPPKATMAAVSTLTATATPPVIPAFPTIPRDAPVELFLNGTWLDVTGDVRASSGIDIMRGRPNEASAPQPSTCALTFDNRSGNYSPRNPVGVYYGQIGRNTPIRVSVNVLKDTFTRSVSNSWGKADTGQTWDNHGTLPVTGSDFGVNGTVATHSIPSAGIFRYNTINAPAWRDVDVAVTVTVPFTTVTGASVFPANVVLRWQNVNFYYLVTVEITTAGHVWIGVIGVDGSPTGVTVIPSVDTGIIHSSSQALRVRAQIEGQSIRAKVWPATGNEPYRWNVTGVDPGIAAAGLAGVRSTVATGNTNTFPVILSYDNVVIRSPRFFGEVASWPQRWDTAGVDVTAPIEAAGVTRRLGQGQSPLTSTLFLGETMQVPAPKAYWPCEDGVDSAYIISGIGGPNMYLNTITSPAVSNSATATTKFASFTGFVASAALPTVGANTTWSGVIPPYTATNSATISFITNIGATAIVDTGVIATLKMAGTGTSWQIRYRSSTTAPAFVGDLSVTVLDASGTNIHDSGAIAFAINEQNILIKLSVTQNGTGVDYNIATLQVGQDVAQFVAHTVASTTVTRATQVIIAEAGELPNTPIGHIGVVDYVGSAFDLATQLKAYSGETALARIKRLCNQITVPLTYYGDFLGNAATNTMRVGAQHVDTALNVIRECADTDLGTLTEPRGDAGLLYRTRASLYAQNVALVLDYAGGQVSPPFEPVDDDQLTRNDVTVTRRDGTSASAMLLTGRMSILDPSQGGVGIYDTGTTMNVADDSQLPDAAGWLLNVGTVDQTRYPKIRVDLANPNISSNAALSAAILDLAVDDSFQIINPKTGQTPDTIYQIARGYSEHIAPFEHSIVINAAPEAPYDIARADVAGVKADTSGSTLAAGVTATATTLSVATPTGALWTTVVGAMPISVNVGGERMTVTAVSGTSSPQTFTVTRSVNGVVKAQTAGAAVSLFFPSPVPL